MPTVEAELIEKFCLLNLWLKDQMLPIGMHLFILSSTQDTNLAQLGSLRSGVGVCMLALQMSLLKIVFKEICQLNFFTQGRLLASP